MVTDFFLSPFGNNDTVLEPGCDEEESINQPCIGFNMSNKNAFIAFKWSLL